MKILKSVCLLLMVGFCASSSQAQDIHYSMFDMAPLELNPAHTGYYAGSFRIGGIYRTQWAGLSISTPPSLNNQSGNFSGYQTPSAYIDVPFGIPPKDGGDMKSWAGVGISFYYDVVGNLSNLAASLSLAYHLGLGQKGNTILSFAAQGGILQRRIDGDYTFEDVLVTPGLPATNDPLFGQGSLTKTLPDFAGGLMISHRGNRFGLEAGASLNHFTNPNYSFVTPDQNEDGEARLPMTLISHLNFRLAISKEGRVFLKPMFFFQNMIATEGTPNGLGAYDFNGQLLLGVHFNDLKDITLYLGGGYRLSGDAIARIGLDIKGLKVGFAYDFNVNDRGLNYQTFASNNRAMAFELGIAYVAKLYKVVVPPTQIVCPRF